MRSVCCSAMSAVCRPGSPHDHRRQLDEEHCQGDAVDRLVGIVDVAVFAPRTWRDWPVILARLVTRRAAAGGPTDVLRGARIDVACDRSLPLEFDGDLSGETRAISVEVLPGALSVCVST